MKASVLKIPPLPAHLTSYDLLKALAIILVVVDHIGLYYHLDELWYRVFGRLCVPIWFFLIGFAKTRHVGRDLVFCAALLTASKFLLGLPIFPINILWNMIFIRLILDLFMRRFVPPDVPALRVMSPPYLLLFIGGMVTLPFVDYGLLGLMFAIAGVEHRKLYDLSLQENQGQDVLKVAKDRAVISLGFACLAFFIWQYLIFDFSKAHLITLGGGLFIVFIALHSFRPKIFQNLKARYIKVCIPVIQFGGRQTLWIYTAHLILFGILGQFIDPERYQLFEWQWFEDSQDQTSS